MLLVTSHWPPFEFEQGGRVRGSDADVIREVFSRLGIPVELRIYPWPRLL